ncbi:Dabb family protein [Rhizobiales bacterium RZME27]|uniref:Dabb family protein n=1 Tax=Endobacterium cereale TaxID=2663029 RepID=A0A6A8AA11_9HYPH|nr:Dabb family protein [Endobacterium cereale]MEB2847049.1 Dabb family protein [Endobacterium cereale]MQY47534.1 Dabb family protein [Endobacterium cereale]
MILHTVLIRFKSSVSAEDKKAIFEAIVSLKEKLSGITEVKYGPNVSPEGLGGGFADALVVTFENVEARDAYLVHADHVVVGEKIVASAEGGLAGLLVFDLEI